MQSEIGRTRKSVIQSSESKPMPAHSTNQPSAFPDCSYSLHSLAHNVNTRLYSPCIALLSFFCPTRVVISGGSPPTKNKPRARHVYFSVQTRRFGGDPCHGRTFLVCNSRPLLFFPSAERLIALLHRPAVHVAACETSPWY